MNVLVIGAHPDDIELGCGGTLLKHRAQGHNVSLLVMTSGERGPSSITSRVQEQEDAADFLGAEILWGGFQDGAIPVGSASVSLIEEVLAQVQPDVVYTHCPRDSRQDHRATAESSIAACRRISQVCFYEGPTTRDFRPALYIDIDGHVEDKVNALRAHVSQVLKNGLVDLEAIEALARYRGFEARKRQAEAFEIERFVWCFDAPAPGTQQLVGSLDLNLPTKETMK